MSYEFTKISFPGLGIKEIDPIRSFSLFGLEIHFYGVIIAVGLLLAVWYGLKRSKEFGLKEDDILDGVLWIVPLAIICARLYYCIFEWDNYKEKTCYYFNDGTYGLYDTACDCNRIILEYSDFDWDNNVGIPTLTEDDHRKFDDFITSCIGLESVVNS